MDLFKILFLFLSIFNLPVAFVKGEKDVLVNYDCYYFENHEKICEEEAELRYPDKDKNNKALCCFKIVELNCLKKSVDTVCTQHKVLHDRIQEKYNLKLAQKSYVCSHYHYECPEEVYNIWIMVILFFSFSIALASFCIICVIYLKS